MMPRAFTLIVQTLSAIDLIDSRHLADGIVAGLSLLSQHALLSNNSDYVTKLEEALVRAYLKTGNADRVEVFSLRAYQHAKSGKALRLQKKTSLALKSRALDDQLHWNLAY